MPAARPRRRPSPAGRSVSWPACSRRPSGAPPARRFRETAPARRHGGRARGRTWRAASQNLTSSDATSASGEDDGQICAAVSRSVGGARIRRDDRHDDPHAFNSPAAELPQDDQNLVWLDMEMTGLSRTPTASSSSPSSSPMPRPDAAHRRGPVLAVHQSDARAGRDGRLEQGHPRQAAASSTASRRRRSTRRGRGAGDRIREALRARAALRRCAATGSARTAASWRATCRSWKPSSITAISTSAR